MKAVLFVDVQKDFIDGALGSDAAKKVTPNIIKYAKECRNKGYSLYATVDTHFDEDYEDTLEGQKLPVKHCISGTKGHEIADGLVKDENRNVIIPEGHIYDKITFGSFKIAGKIADDFGESGGMDPYCGEDDLGDLGEPLDEIQICGFCTDICVVSNALILRANFPNTKITVISDLCAGTSEAAHDAALTVMKSCQIDVATVDTL